jgi:hypothetical protein
MKRDPHKPATLRDEQIGTRPALSRRSTLGVVGIGAAAALAAAPAAAAVSMATAE